MTQWLNCEAITFSLVQLHLLQEATVIIECGTWALVVS